MNKTDIKIGFENELELLEKEYNFRLKLLESIGCSDRELIARINLLDEEFVDSTYKLAQKYGMVK